MVDANRLFATIIFYIVAFISLSSADYSIRTRGNIGNVLDVTSPTVISTLGIPPYISNFYNDSDGLVPDLLRHLERKGVLSKNYSLVCSVSPTLGQTIVEPWTGLMSDVRNKYTHYVIGPTPANIVIYPGTNKIIKLTGWTRSEVVLVVRIDSPLANELPYSTLDDQSKFKDVKLIVVEDSAEDKLLSDSRSNVGDGLVELQKRLSRAENTVKVKNVCEGIRLLELRGNDQVLEQKALVINSLDAQHFISGNRRAAIVKPADRETSMGEFIVISNPQFESIANHFEKALKQLSEDGVLQKVVEKWSKYDEKSCERLEAALSTGTEPTALAKSLTMLIVTLVNFVTLRFI